VLSDQALAILSYSGDSCPRDSDVRGYSWLFWHGVSGDQGCSIMSTMPPQRDVPQLFHPSEVFYAYS
jgi:hypothetical protein